MGQYCIKHKVTTFSDHFGVKQLIIHHPFSNTPGDQTCIFPNGNCSISNGDRLQTCSIQIKINIFDKLDQMLSFN
jgi:hypothetical protein